MRTVVIGGSGHIGTFLIPRLVRAGHEVVSISRGQSSSYLDDPTGETYNKSLRIVSPKTVMAPSRIVSPASNPMSSST